MASTVEFTGERRLLGHQEMYQYSLSQLPSPVGAYVSINMIESKKEVTLDDVKYAFEKVSETNFLLRARIEQTDESAYFAPMNDLHGNGWMGIDETSIETEKDWTQVLPKILERKIDLSSGPLWHVKWIKVGGNANDGLFSYILVAVFLHSISDGRSGFNLIRNQILPYLNNKTPDVKPIYFGKCVESAVYDFDDDMLPIKRRAVSVVYRLFTDAMVAKQKIGSLFSSKVDNAVDYVNQFDAVTLSKETSTAFIRLCKKRQVTVHSLMMVVVHNALHFAKQKYKLELSLEFLPYAIDVRKFIDELNDPSKMPLGDYHKLGQHLMKFVNIENETELFKRAEEINAGVKMQNIPTQEHTLFDCMFHLIQKENLTLETMSALPSVTIFSNLGNCDVMCGDDNSGDDDVILKEHFFTMQTWSGVFVTVCSYKGQMRFVVSSGLSAGPSKFITKVIKSNIEYLVNVYLDENEV